MKAYITISSSENIDIDAAVSGIAGCYNDNGILKEYGFRWDKAEISKSTVSDDTDRPYRIRFVISDVSIALLSQDGEDENIEAHRWVKLLDILKKITSLRIAVRIDEVVLPEDCDTTISFGNDQGEERQTMINADPELNFWGYHDSCNDDEDYYDDEE